jgi:glycosyltransferase involved in cell wall biosynthesis
MASEVAVVSTGHDVADARIHKIVSALIRRGLNVQVWGLGRADQGPQGAEVRVTTRGGLVRRATRAVLLPWRADADLLVTVDPDTVASARLASRVRRRRLVVDVHEDYAMLLRDRPWARGAPGVLARWLVALSTSSAARADLTVVADDHVPPLLARQRLVVKNAPDWTYLPSPTAPGSIPRALYIGDVRSSRGLFEMLSALSQAPGWHLDVVGPVAANDSVPLSAALERHDLTNRVRFHGRLPPAAAWRLAEGAWVGLALLQDTPAFRDAVPTKLDEYIATGLPVIVSDLPRPAGLIRNSGAGAVVRSPSEAAEVLRALVDSPAFLQRLRTAAVNRRATILSSESPYDDLADRILSMLRSTNGGQPS